MRLNGEPKKETKFNTKPENIGAHNIPMMTESVPATPSPKAKASVDAGKKAVCGSCFGCPSLCGGTN